MRYTPTTWIDGETPVNAENLNKLESGVAAAVVSVNGTAPDENGNVQISVSSDSTQNAGVHIGDTPPEDTSLLWVDTSDETEDEDPLEGYYTSTETDNAIKSYVDTALGVIENGAY